MGKFTLLTSITLDSAGFKSGTDAVKGNVSQLKDGIKAANDASKASFNEVATAVIAPQQNLQEMMKAYRALKNTSFAGKTPEEIDTIKSKMAGLIDEIGDYNNTLKAMAKDPFEKYAQGAAGISTMLQGVTAGLGLVGVKSDLVNTMTQKTVLLMGLSNSLQQAAIFFKENALGIDIKNGIVNTANLIRNNALKSIEITQQNIANGSLVAGAGATGILTSAQLMLNTAIAANPIGLMIAGVVALTAVAIALTIAFSDNNDELEKNAQLILNYQGYVKSLGRDLERAASINKANGMSERDLLKEKLTGIQQLDDLNTAEINRLIRREKLTDEEVEQLKLLREQQIKFTQEIDNTTTAIVAQGIVDKATKQAQRAAGQEFVNQLRIQQKVGKDKELAELNDWKNKSIEKYKEQGDVVSAILGVYNKKKLDINKKYDEQIKKSETNSINGFADEFNKNLDTQINSINNKLEGIDGKEIEIKLKPIATDELLNLQDKTNLTGNALNGLSDAFIEMAETGKMSVKGLMVATLGSIRQIVIAKLAEAMMSQTASNSKFGLPGLVMAAAGITGVMAIFSKLPKFATGGIVGGDSYNGDMVTARVNSGEMILSRIQQNNLFDMLSGGNMGTQQHEFVISGDTLVAINNKMTKKQNYR